MGTSTLSATAADPWGSGTSAPTGYLIYRDGTKVAEVPASPMAYNDPGLADGTRYCYNVRSKTDAGTSDDSNEACATTPGGGEASRNVDSGNLGGYLSSVEGPVTEGGYDDGADREHRGLEDFGDERAPGS